MGTISHENYTFSLGFSRADASSPDTTRDVGALRGTCPYLRANRFQGRRPLPRKENSSRDPRQRFRAPKRRSPCRGSGILTDSLSDHRGDASIAPLQNGVRLSLRVD
ncbi:unnamed protein product [Clavelina lepadiformis]|uniref:Uncharacterized protein n=1 Tax=Clavelina lepadiformis TaxID=159417 RepID=A0ABP0FBW5_CLALP